ncbi:MAG: hypothetical protein R2771_11335 [Saprospiraceae bacterium]
MTAKLKIRIFSIFVFFISTVVCSNIFAQETIENYNTSFDLTTIKKSDKSRDLKVEFSASNKEDKKEVIAVAGAEVEFYNVLDDEESLLGKVATDEKGFAILNLPSDQKYLTDADGYFTIVARYAGNDNMDSEESELMLKDLFLELEVSEEDSVRTMTLNAYTIDSEGEKQDVEELDVILGVQGLLSRLVLDEGTLEAGSYEFEVPENVHGNSDGILTLYGYVDDNMDFGNVYVSKAIDDKSSVVYNSHEDNKLWTKAAPIWMYVVLSIMLLGVWANYFYTVVKLTKIKKMGNH